PPNTYTLSLHDALPIWINSGKTANDPGKARVKALEGHFDPLFRGFDLDYSDVKRADRFIAEWTRLERAGGLPQLSILRLPNDHTDRKSTRLNSSHVEIS